MSVVLFLGIRLPDKPYERVIHKLEENDYLTYTVDNLKEFIVREILECSSDNFGLELIHCGLPLDDSTLLIQEGIKSGSTIHVYEKNIEPETDKFVFTADGLVGAYVASTKFESLALSFPRTIRLEVINQILEKYPEFNNDLGAYAILRDPVLLEKIFEAEHSSKIGKKHPILIKAANFIADIIISNSKTATPSVQPRVEDSLSDSSASENDSASPQTSPNHAENRRISRNQLAAALRMAGSSMPSMLLPNFTDRIISGEGVATTSNNTVQSNEGGPSTIQNQAQGDSHTSVNRQQYAVELQIMRDMGLTEESNNIQALIICNGNVEAAVNLVLGIGAFT